MAEIYSVKSQASYMNQLKAYLIAKNSKLNNFNTGSRLLTICEAFSISASIDSSEFFLALKKAIPVMIYSGFEFPKKEGQKSIGKLKFKRTEPAAIARPIAEGTIIQLGALQFETTEAGSIEVGNTESAELNARAVAIGVNGNIGILDIDTKNGKGFILNPPAGIEFAVNNSAFYGGTDSESDENRRLRFISYINGLAKSNLAGVVTGLNTIIGLVNYFIRSAYPTPGYVTVIAEDGPGTLSVEMRDMIYKVLLGDINDLDNYPGYLALGIALYVTAPIVKPVSIEFDVVVKNTSVLLTDLDLQAEFLTNLTTVIEQNINGLKIGENLVVSELITLVQNFDAEVYDLDEIRDVSGTPVVLNLGDEIIALTEEVLRTGLGSGGLITVNLFSTSDY